MASPRDLRLLAYFVQIARAGSIRGAAAQLSLSPAVISEALSELEQVLGVTLLRRTTRSMTLTDAGADVLHHASLAVSAADAAMTVGKDEKLAPRGLVRLTLPIELSLAWLQPILREFEKHYADVRVEVHADDAIVPLAASQFDLAIRMVFSPEPRKGRDVCCCLPLELVCVPELIGDGSEALEDRLDRIGIIGSATHGQNRRRLQVFDNAAGKRQSRDVDAPCRFTVNNQVVAHRLALEGFGAALLIALTVADDLNTGRLVRVDKKCTYGCVVASVMARDRYPSHAARVFMNHLLPDSSTVPGRI